MNLNLTLIGQTLTFLLFVAFCWKYVWPALISVMKEREQKIADGLNAAERAGKDLELAQAQVNDQLKDAKEQAASIIDQANKRANQIIEEAKAQATVEGDRIKSAAEAEVVREISRAREELRGKVASLVVVGAEKILGATVDAKAHSDMLTKLSAEL